MNSAILITSVGAKIPLIRAVRRAKDEFDDSIQIIGADADAHVTASSFVDVFWQTPSFEELTYERLLTYIKIHNIRYVIPTRDAELPFFARHKKNLESEGVKTFVANEDAVAFCYDKFHFFEDSKTAWVIPTALDINGLQTDSYVVKERFGAGSKSMAINVNGVQALLHAKRLKEAIFQPFIEGKEYSIDCYVDRNMVCRGVIVRSRDVVVDGESKVTTIARDVDLAEKAAEFVSRHKIQGHSVLQVLKNAQGSFLIECNARFGGASTLSEYAGLKSFLWFLKEANGIEFKAKLTDKIIKQVREEKEDSYFES